MRSRPRFPRPRLTYANVVSTLCLFLLLGGVAYAGVRLAANSVGTKQLKNEAVTLQKIDKQTRGELKGATGLKGPRGERGPQGERGAQGEKGPQGIPGTTGPLVVNASTGEIAADTTSRDVALTGTTSWTPQAGQVGVLLASATLTLATNGESIAETCIPILRLLDNGHPAGSVVLNLGGGPGTATPQQYTAEGPVEPVAVLEPGVPHTITAHYLGENAGDCAPGSKIDNVRVVVAPLGQ